VDENVRRAVNSGLLIVERNIRNLIKELEHNQNSNWILQKSVNDIPEESIRKLIEKSELMLTGIRRLEQTYNLEQNVVSTRWRLMNSLAEIWSVLNELTPERLTGYGSITAGENDTLTMRINEILALCNDMRTILAD